MGKCQGGKVMNERRLVREAMEAMKNGQFNCMPIPEIRDSKYQFDADTHNMVSEAGCQLKWLDTFKGGCWHVVPLSE